MGNWRTVMILGEIPEKYLKEMKAYFTYDYMKDENVGEWNCLSITEGIAGLGNWIQRSPNAVGNLAERDYSVDSVKDVMKMIGEKWPDVKLTIHCGGESESDTVVNTLELKDGKVKKMKPKIETLPGMNEELMESRLKYAIYGKNVETEMRRCKECRNNPDKYVDVEVAPNVTLKVIPSVAEKFDDESVTRIHLDFCGKCGVVKGFA